jgi:hypothetical protein
VRVARSRFSCAGRHADCDRASGTIEEIKRKVEAKSEVLIYFMSKPVLPEDIDSDQLVALRDFKRWCTSRGIYRECASDIELAHEFHRDLTRVIRRLHGGGSGRGPSGEPSPSAPSPQPVEIAPLEVGEASKGELRALVTQTRPMFDSAITEFDVDRARQVMQDFARRLSLLAGELARGHPLWLRARSPLVWLNSRRLLTAWGTSACI